MYTTTIQVPRITLTQLDAMRTIVPNLEKLAVIPVVDSPAKAEAQALTILNRYLQSPEARYEYQKSFDGVTLDEATQLYTVTYTIAGD